MATILIIDDDAALREVLRKILAAHGYEVLLAPDGEEGLALQRKRPADLILTDIIMPGKEGLETIRELRKEHPRVKIIAMSGGGTLRPADYLPAARQFGADRTLTKPFENDALLAVVREVLAG